MAKTEFLQIRLSPEDLQRVKEAANSDYLDTSTWARRVIMLAVREAEANKESGKNDVHN